MKQYVAYLRVSTEGQGIGLDAQAASIAQFINHNGGDVIKTVSEKASGKTIDRTGLKAAINLCRDTGATLIVAKLDRLSRDIADIFTLKRNGLDFEVVDLDTSDTLILGIFASLAEKERQLISTRTKEALDAKKAKKNELLAQADEAEQRGNNEQAAALRMEADKIKLGGNPHAADAIRKVNHMGHKARREEATNATANRHAWMAIRLMDGTLQSKADFLNDNGYRTTRNKRFSPMAVARLIARYSQQDS